MSKALRSRKGFSRMLRIERVTERNIMNNGEQIFQYFRHCMLHASCTILKKSNRSTTSSQNKTRVLPKESSSSAGWAPESCRDRRKVNVVYVVHTAVFPAKTRYLQGTYCSKWLTTNWEFLLYIRVEYFAHNKPLHLGIIRTMGIYSKLM